MLALAGGVVAGFVTAGLTVRVGATEAGVLAATDGTTDAAAARDGSGDGV